MPRCERWTWVVLEEAARRSWHSRADGVGERWFLGSQNSNTKTLMPVWGFPGGGRGTWRQRNLQRAERSPPGQGDYNLSLNSGITSGWLTGDGVIRHCA